MSVQDTEVAAGVEEGAAVPGAAEDQAAEQASGAPEVQATEEGEATPKPAATTRHKLPDGVHTPIEFRNHIVTKGIAPADLKPQQVYGWVKSPGKGEARFPVAHYDAQGNKFDTAQINEHGVTLTRPGVILEAAIEWYKGYDSRKAERQAARAQKAKEKLEKAQAAAAKAGTAEDSAANEAGAAGDATAAEVTEGEGHENWDEVEAQ